MNTKTWVKCLGHDFEDWWWEYAEPNTAGYFENKGEARDHWILNEGKDSTIHYYDDPRYKDK